MVYFGYYLVNPHVQTVQNMSGKGGYRVLQAELGAAKVYPILKKTAVNAVLKKQIRPQFSKYRFQNESALGHKL